MKPENYRGWLLLIGSASAFAASTTVVADAQDQAPSAASATSLEEVVVTAQRREESMQKVPVAITTITAETLARSGVTGTDQLAQDVPGLSITKQLNASTPFIRGIGTTATSPGDEPPVALYVDGVYYANPQADVFDFNNIERVEVLKGPQGTLFGRNATGGLINVVTPDPQVTPSMKADVSYGNFQTVRGNAYMTGGVGDFAADLAIHVAHQGQGFGRDFLGEDINYERNEGARVKMLWAPTSKDKLTLSVDWTEEAGDLGYPTTLVQPNSGYTANSYGFFGEHPTANPYDSDSDVAPSAITQHAGVSLKYVHDLGGAEFSLLSAYRHLLSLARFSLANTNPTEVPPGFFSDLIATVHDSGETYQEEALLTGTAAKLDYTAGLFFFYSDQGYIAPGGVAIRGVGPFLGGASTDRLDHQLTNSYAAFGQASYAIADDTKLTAGLRYTVDYQRAIEELLDPTTGQPVPPPSNDGPLVSGRAHFPKLTWRFALEHNFTDDTMAYVSYNRGFKSGLFNLGAGPLPTAPRGAAPASVSPEQLDAYEVGLKNEFFDHQFRVNLAAFHYHYENIQVSKLVGGTLVLFNSGAANLNGGELETIYLHPVGPGTLQLNATAAYLDAHYGRFCNGPDSRSAADLSYNGGAACDPVVNGVPAPRPYYGDLTGDTMIESPKLTYQVGADYRMPVAGNELGLNVNYSWTARFFWEADDRIQQPSYGIVNSQVSYGFGPGGRYTAALWGHNIGNKLYYVYGTSSATFGDAFGAGAPRTYGATFGVKF